ncbi:hypothetical protein NMY22_g16475 [Coprinellus aureogranulatus]|nr:hypothetical protein NMY22_g16475 [Coprinellus aureogranulatus]
MRQKRAKAYRKLMHLYSHFFGFRQPFQMLIDAETCVLAMNGKFDLVKQLSTVLQGEVKPMITQCCIHELYLKGKAFQEAVDIAKNFERRKCNHREAIPGDDCLADVVGDSNKHRYVIVTQSNPLRNQLRRIPAVPIVHMNRSVMILEPPSDATLRKKALAEAQLLGASTSDRALLEASKPEEAPRKKKGPKGPNPLSVKKKKVEGQTTPLEKKTSGGKPQPLDKGKGEAISTAGRSGEDASLGKRKRPREDEGDGASGNGAGMELKAINASEMTQAKKRRRRRKALQHATAETKEEDGPHSES